jgi:hypothetical protein
MMSADSASSSSPSSVKSKKFEASKPSFHFFNLFGGSDDGKASEAEVEEGNRKLMDDKIFNQNDVDEDDEEKNNHTIDDAIESPSNDAKKPVDKKELWDSIIQLMTGGKENALENMVNLVSTAMASQQGDLSTTESSFSAEDFKNVMTTLIEQLKNNFQDVPVFDIDPMAFVYYIEKEDERTNPSWKRRIHRFMPSIKMETIHGLNDALYLSNLAYVNVVEEIQHGLKNYKGAKYELVYATTDCNPHEPANFLLMKKEGASPGTMKGLLGPLTTKSYVECVLVVRGTKTIEDALSDGLLEATPYRDGMAHDGVCKSGLFLVEKHTDVLLNILKTSGRDKVKLTILGHSLGAVRLLAF